MKEDEESQLDDIKSDIEKLEELKRSPKESSFDPERGYSEYR